MTDPATTNVREERKVVSALFADLVGSTALGESLDPEEAKLVVGEAISRIVREIEELGGHVKDLAGDGVLAFFGAPVSSEDDAERAVRAGLRIAEEMHAYATEVEQAWGVEGFGVRVGVGTGPVVLGALGAGSRVEYAAFGDTVNVAARLQSAAAPGRVLVDEATALAVEGAFETDEPVALELKGKSRPVTALTVLRARGPGARRRGVPGTEAALVGRDRELARAEEWLERLRGGAGGALVLVGEAGIGKSRLLAELHRRFDGAPVEGAQPVWLEGRCVSYGESLPLWPFRDLLREWLGVSVEEPELRVRVLLRRRVEELFGGRAPEIYPYLGSVLGITLEPDAGARVAELSPEALQYRTFEVVGALLARLAEDGPVVCAIEDLHWADPTSVQLVERLLPLTEDAAVLLVLAQREERDHACWALKELAAREYPHLYRELALEPLSGDAERELLHSLTGAGTLPEELSAEILAQAEGNPFFLEELVRSLADAGALVREDDGWRFDHEVPIEIPQTVERVIVARIDRLDPACHDVLTAAAALGRRFGLALLEGVAGRNGEVHDALHELQRLDLVRTERRWPQPEYRFKHALIQEAAYRLLVGETRTALHRRAAEWLERQHAGNTDEVVGLLAHHWRAAADDDKAIAYLTRAADRARHEWALDEAVEHYRALLPLLEARGERREMALALFKLALALHTDLRFAEANEAYGRAFELWTPPAESAHATETLRMASSYVPRVFDPLAAGFWPDIQACMQLFDRLVEAGPERTIVPALADRWEISADGRRYVFHLREGLTWSDGAPLTAHDVEFGVKRMLEPDGGAASVPIYFVLEGGQGYFLREHDDPDRIGVQALDEHTVEFRLVAPAPYFMSVMNRPDGGPIPRHAVERDGPRWTEPDRQVVSGPFRVAEQSPERLVLERNERSGSRHTGNVHTVEVTAASADDGLAALDRGDLDLVRVMYTPRTSDHVRARQTGDGPPTWTAYLAFRHSDPVVGRLDVRRALGHAVDRAALAEVAPANLVIATGGLVPPPLQGHTPDIVLPLDGERARESLAAAGLEAGTRLSIVAQDVWLPIVDVLVAGWREVLGIETDVQTWSAEQVDEVAPLGRPLELAQIAVLGWLPGYPDPEYCLRLLLHSHARANEGRYSYALFDEVIEAARHEPNGRQRLELYHQADRLAVTDQAAVIPLGYGRSMAFAQPWVHGWWEFAKTSSSYADLVVERS